MAKKKSPELETKTLKAEQLNPQTRAEFIQRAWLYYSSGEFLLSVKDYQAALEDDAGDVDAWYGLALVYKALGNSSQALKYFEGGLPLIEKLQDKQRAQILVRLIHGQINQIKTGDWNLEKEV